MAMRRAARYTPPKVWQREKPSGGTWAMINAPTAGARKQEALKVSPRTCDDQRGSCPEHCARASRGSLPTSGIDDTAICLGVDRWESTRFSSTRSARPTVSR